MKHLTILVVAAALSLGMTPPSHAADSPPPVPSQPASPEHTIKGDVQLIEGEFYFVKDISGHEVRLHVNGGTKLEDRIKVGDKIEARVTSEGHAMSILLQIPQNGTAPPLSNTGPISLQRVPEGPASQ
jgi:hypothetical protein